MPRKTSQIVTDLRDIATGHDLDGQMVLGNILREAADRLEEVDNPQCTRILRARRKHA